MIVTVKVYGAGEVPLEGAIVNGSVTNSAGEAVVEASGETTFHASKPGYENLSFGCNVDWLVGHVEMWLEKYEEDTITDAHPTE